MTPGGSPWSPRQRRWLQALGHVVLRVGGDDGPDAITDRMAEDEVAARPEPVRSMRTPGGDATPRRAPAPPSPAEPSPTAGEPAMRRPPRRPSRLPDRLQLAMLRASGLDPADPAAQAAMAQWPVDRLRGDAAAKRAFWPQLRALRRRAS